MVVGALLPPPFPFTPVLITAGVMQYPRRKFLGALSAGRALRFFAAAGLSRIYGQQIINVFSAHYDFMLKVAIAIAIVTAIGAVAYFAWYRSKLRREKQAQHSGTPASNRAHTHAPR